MLGICFYRRNSVGVLARPSRARCRRPRETLPRYDKRTRSPFHHRSRFQIVEAFSDTPHRLVVDSRRDSSALAAHFRSSTELVPITRDEYSNSTETRRLTQIKSGGEYWGLLY